LAPEKPYSQYRHNNGENNADAHLKRTIIKPYGKVLYKILQKVKKYC
jgi:thiamine phosphate synthase YjbQ (UPF0047 family)